MRFRKSASFTLYCISFISNSVYITWINSPHKSTANGYGNDKLTIQANIFSSNVKIKWLFNSYRAFSIESKDAKFCEYKYLYFQTELPNIINYINSCCCNNITTAACTWDVVNSNEYKFAWLSSKQVLISVYCCVQGTVYNAKRLVFTSRSITFYT